MKEKNAAEDTTINPVEGGVGVKRQEKMPSDIDNTIQRVKAEEKSTQIFCQFNSLGLFFIKILAQEIQAWLIHSRKETCIPLG